MLTNKNAGRRFVFTTTALLASVGPQVAHQATAHAIDTGWTYEQAFQYADDGLWEPYTWGGGWWFDDDSGIRPCNAPSKDQHDGSCGRNPRSWAQATGNLPEGPDCAGYVGKVWAVNTGITDENRYFHPYASGAWSGDRSHTFNGQQEWKPVKWSMLQGLDALANGNHIFMYYGQDSKGRMTTLEAMDTRDGVVPNTRTWDSVEKNYSAETRFMWAHGNKNVH
jgi:cell wall-associated NlpC family hydrolase